VVVPAPSSPIPLITSDVALLAWVSTVPPVLLVSWRSCRWSPSSWRPNPIVTPATTSPIAESPSSSKNLEKLMAMLSLSPVLGSVMCHCTSACVTVGLSTKRYK